MPRPLSGVLVTGVLAAILAEPALTACAGFETVGADGGSVGGGGGGDAGAGASGGSAGGASDSGTGGGSGGGTGGASDSGRGGGSGGGTGGASDSGTDGGSGGGVAVPWGSSCLVDAGIDGGPEYLYVWVADDDGNDNDYVAVVDINDSRSTYSTVLSTTAVGSKRNEPHHGMPEPFSVKFVGTGSDGGSTYRSFWPISGMAGNRTWIFEISDPANPAVHAILGPGGPPAGPKAKWPFGWDHDTTIAPSGRIITSLWSLQASAWNKVHGGPNRSTPGALMEYDYLGSIKRVFPAFDATKDYSCVSGGAADGGIDPAVDLHCTLNPYEVMSFADKGILLSTDHSDIWSLGTPGVAPRFRNTIRVWQYDPADSPSNLGATPVLRQTLALQADPSDPTSNLAPFSVRGTIVTGTPGTPTEKRHFFAATAEGGGVYRCTFTPFNIPAWGLPNDPANPIIECDTKPFHLTGFGATLGPIVVSPALPQAGNHRYLLVTYGKNDRLVYFDLGVDGRDVALPARQVATIATNETPHMSRPTNDFNRVYVTHFFETLFDIQVDGSRDVRRIDLTYTADGGVNGVMRDVACFEVRFGGRYLLDGGYAGYTLPTGGGRPHMMVSVGSAPPAGTPAFPPAILP